jgi:hypothetical protein
MSASPESDGRPSKCRPSRWAKPEIVALFGTRIGIPFGVARGHNMKLPRCRFLHLAADAAALPALSHIARVVENGSEPGAAKGRKRHEHREPGIG